MENYMKILVAQESDIAVSDTKPILEKLGYGNTSVAETGVDVIEKAEMEYPDLILMDTKLGGLLDGVETANILSYKQKIPIIFLTSPENKETVNKVKSTGIGFLLKPLNAAKLSSAIEKIINEKRTRIANRIKENMSRRQTENRGSFIFWLGTAALLGVSALLMLKNK
jgi:two-component system response regulator AlgR